ncbi:Hypothetical predicted protein, partial [Paramuricea clavata]
MNGSRKHMMRLSPPIGKRAPKVMHHALYKTAELIAEIKQVFKLFEEGEKGSKDKKELENTVSILSK